MKAYFHKITLSVLCAGSVLMTGCESTTQVKPNMGDTLLISAEPMNETYKKEMYSSSPSEYKQEGALVDLSYSVEKISAGDSGEIVLTFKSIKKVGRLLIMLLPDPLIEIEDLSLEPVRFSLNAGGEQRLPLAYAAKQAGEHKLKVFATIKSYGETSMREFIVPIRVE